MQFDIRATLSSNLFYALTIEKNKPHYFFPIRSLSPQSQLTSKPYELADRTSTTFTIEAVGQKFQPESPADVVGYLFKSNLPVANYRTSILSYARAWQQTTAKVEVTANETTLVFKDEHFLMYHVPGKATLVTSLSISDNLHEFLTMI